MRIYCDGGGRLFKKSDRVVISWGIVIEDADELIELSSARDCNRHLMGMHEYIAFIEAVVYARAHNGNTLNTHIITDCVELRDLNEHASRGNTLEALKMARNKLEKLRSIFSHEAIELAAQYIAFSRITWQRGHSTCVNHARADYLATTAREIFLGGKIAALPFEFWLKKGFSVSGSCRRWIPHFCVQPAQA